jgi:hypothetical protein
MSCPAVGEPVVATLYSIQSPFFTPTVRSAWAVETKLNAIARIIIALAIFLCIQCYYSDISIYKTDVKTK